MSFRMGRVPLWSGEVEDRAGGTASKLAFLAQAWVIAGISFQGLTMAVLGDKFVGYAAFDSVADANRAAQILADIGSSKPAARRL